jgi:hypothetical protein
MSIIRLQQLPWRHARARCHAPGGRACVLPQARLPAKLWSSQPSGFAWLAGTTWPTGACCTGPIGTVKVACLRCGEVRRRQLRMHMQEWHAHEHSPEVQQCMDCRLPSVDLDGPQPRQVRLDCACRGVGSPKVAAERWGGKWRGKPVCQGQPQHPTELLASIAQILSYNCRLGSLSPTRTRTTPHQAGRTSKQRLTSRGITFCSEWPSHAACWCQRARTDTLPRADAGQHADDMTAAD